MSIGNVQREYNLAHHFINLNCTGTEDSVWSCPASSDGHLLCQSYHDASVACHGKTHE